MNVYLVDDDSEDHEIFGMALEQTSLNADFTSFYSGADLLTHLRDKNVVKATNLLIFTDLNMPKMNGFELITQLLTHNYLSKYKVVVYSTSSNADYQKKAKDLGASSYVTKPSDFRTLVTTLQKLLPELWMS